MLVLSRRIGERIVVPACGVTITVVAIRGGKIRLGVTAPSDIAIHREEVWHTINANGNPEEPFPCPCES
jgi:carbon storage regulator